MNLQCYRACIGNEFAMLQMHHRYRAWRIVQGDCITARAVQKNKCLLMEHIAVVVLQHLRRAIARNYTEYITVYAVRLY